MQKMTAFKLILIIHVLTTSDKWPLNVQIYLVMIYILKLLHQRGYFVCREGSELV